MGRVSNEDLISMLYGFIATPLRLTNRDGNPISCSKDQASKIKNRTINAHQTIRDHCQDPRLEKTLVADFEKMVIPKLQKSKSEKLASTLLESINASDCTFNTREEFSALASPDNMAELLSKALQESLVWDNKIIQSTFSPKSPPQRYNNAKHIEVPDVISEQEMPYVHALMRVYGEAEGMDEFESDDLNDYKTHKSHFQRQRKDYYSAEFVRRCMRDSYTNEADNQFKTLEDEVYDGVIDTYEADYSSGKKRLGEVLAQASRIPVDKCWASRDTDWIGNSEKKGICHILTNNERIKGWLNEDQ